MDVRATFTGKKDRPSYGLPQPKVEAVREPRGSVKAMVQMYEKRIRDASEEVEESSKRMSSVGRLTVDRLKPYLKEASPEPEINRVRSQSSNKKDDFWLKDIDAKPSIKEEPCEESIIINSNALEKETPPILVGVKEKDYVESVEFPRQGEKGKRNDSGGSKAKPQTKILAEKVTLKLSELGTDEIKEGLASGLVMGVYQPEIEKKREEGFAIDKNPLANEIQSPILAGPKEKDHAELVEVQAKSGKEKRKVDKGFKNKPETKNKEKILAEKVTLKLSDLGSDEITVKLVSEEPGVNLAEIEKKVEENKKEIKEEILIEDNGTVVARNEENDVAQGSEADHEAEERRRRRHKRRAEKEERKRERKQLEAELELPIQVKTDFEITKKCSEHPNDKITPEFEGKAVIEEGVNEILKETEIIADVKQKGLNSEVSIKEASIQHQDKNFSDSRLEPKVSKAKKTKDEPKLFPPESDTLVLIMPKVPEGHLTQPIPEATPPLIVLEPISCIDPQQNSYPPNPPESFHEEIFTKMTSKPTLETPFITPTHPTGPLTPVSSLTAPISKPMSPFKSSHFSEQPTALKSPSLHSKPSTSNNLPIEVPKAHPSLSLPEHLDTNLRQKPAVLPLNPTPKQLLPGNQSNTSHIFVQLPKIRSVGSQEALESKLIKEIDILCTNCYECVPVDEVDTHSAKCIKPSVEIAEVNIVDIRITKMLKSISTRKLESSGSKYSSYCKLEEYSIAILECSMNSYHIEEKLEELFTESLTLTEGLPITIFAKRLSNLLELKGTFTVENHGEDLLKIYQEEAERQKRELEKWKLRSELLLQLAGNPANQGIDVDSEVGSGRSSVISFSTGFSDLNNDVGDIADIEQVLQAISEEELEKHFYGLCVRAKMSLPKGHPSQSLVISDLYKQIQSSGLPVSQWKDYVSRIIGK